MGVLEVAEPRNQPLRKEGAVATQVEDLMRPRRDQFLRRDRDPRKAVRQRRAIDRCAGRQRQAARACTAFEQPEAQPFLERPDLVAHGALRNVQLERGFRKTQMARRATRRLSGL